MPFIASNGLTEAGTSKTIQAGGHDCALPRYRRGRAGAVPAFLRSRHHRVDHVSQGGRRAVAALPLHPDGPAELFSKTGPIVYREGVHAVQARTAVALLDALGIERAHWVGNSQGGQSAMVAAISYPERVTKFVMGGSHIGTGGDRYLMANRPSEGSRATRQALDDPSRENIRRYLRVHIDDESLVTDELVDYIHRAHTWSPEFIEARAAVGEPAARLHARPRRHPGAGAADPRALRPDGAVRGLHRDPEPHRRLAPRAAQQLRALAALREAGRVGRAGPGVPAGLLRAPVSEKHAEVLVEQDVGVEHDRAPRHLPGAVHVRSTSSRQPERS